MGIGTWKSQAGICMCKFQALLSLISVLEEIQGSIKGLGLFFPRNGKGQSSPALQPPTELPPQSEFRIILKENPENIWPSGRERSKWTPSGQEAIAGFPVLGRDTKAIISWDHRVLKVGKDSQGRVQTSAHVPP